VSKRSGFYPCPGVDTAVSNVVSQAGGLLLTEAIRTVGLDAELSAALAGWRHPNARHDPAKIVRPAPGHPNEPLSYLCLERP
jgi:hypothetical protein